MYVCIYIYTNIYLFVSYIYILIYTNIYIYIYIYIEKEKEREREREFRDKGSRETDPALEALSLLQEKKDTRGTRRYHKGQHKYTYGYRNIRNAEGY